MILTNDREFTEAIWAISRTAAGQQVLIKLRDYRQQLLEQLAESNQEKIFFEKGAQARLLREILGIIE